MHKSIQRITTTLLSLCFLAGILSITYQQCEMPLPEPKQTMAGMNCADMQKTEQAKKQCCADLSCPKCFSVMAGLVKFDAAQREFALNTSPFSAPYPLPSASLSLPERPPKIA